MKTKLRKLIPWIVGSAFVALAVVLFVKFGPAAKSSAATTFRTATVERKTISSRVTATGTLSARTTVQVGSQVSGRIAELLVDWNHEVKKGQVLAKIDPRPFKAALDRARASAAVAQASLAKAKAGQLLAQQAAVRTRKLKEEGLASQAEVDQAEAQLATATADVSTAHAQIAQASAALSEASLNLEFTTILSPIDGIVLSRTIDLGQTVAASLQSPTLFTIAQDLRRIQVDTFIAEADVGKLKAGMDALFTVDAYPGKSFKGKVREVRNAAQTVQNVVTYDAVLDVDNDALELKPGMTANVSFVVAERLDVLVIPNAALRFRPSADLVSSSVRSAGSVDGVRSGGRQPGSARPLGSARPRREEGASRRTVWLLRDQALTQVRIETGLTDGTTTEVISGLNEGEQVVTDVQRAPGAATAVSPLGAPARGGGGGRRGI